jgi:hypothetical protein
VVETAMKNRRTVSNVAVVVVENGSVHDPSTAGQIALKPEKELGGLVVQPDRDLLS